MVDILGIRHTDGTVLAADLERKLLDKGAQQVSYSNSRFARVKFNTSNDLYVRYAPVNYDKIIGLLGTGANVYTNRILRETIYFNFE